METSIFKSNYISYEIITDVTQWNVTRRYSDFDWLRQTLKKIHPGLYCPPLPQKKLGSRRFENDFVAKRMKYLNKNNYDASFECYVCSCGFYYCIHSFGIPTNKKIFPCLECHQLYGLGPKVKEGGPSNHGMVIRKGHYIIFKNQEDKESQFKKYGEPEGNITNILYED